MSFDVWVFYVLTVLALMSTPGPSHLLMLSNSAAHGFRRSMMTAFGDLAANLLQMLAVGLGLAAIIASSVTILLAIKWAGVAYLIYLGVKMILKRPTIETIEAEQKTSLRALWLQGFLTSAANPKAVVFFTALFPQFLSSDYGFWPQFIILSATYLAIDGMFLSGYGAAARWLSNKLKGPSRVWLDRIGGGLMIGAAVLLGFKSIQRT